MRKGVHLTDEQLERLKTAYLNGMKYRDMVKELGVTPNTICHYVKKMGWPGRQHFRFPPSDEILLKEYVDNQLSSTDIAKKYGCLQGSVHRHLVKLGVNRNRSEAREAFRQRLLRETGLPYILDSQGYPRTRVPAGFQTSGRVEGGMVRLHNLEMEKHLGRAIGKGEVIHHINFDKTDNRIENLHLCKSMSEHFRLHHTLEEVIGELIEEGVVEFASGRYVINEEKLKEFLESRDSFIPDPMPRI